jgi:hypothetical protein
MRKTKSLPSRLAKVTIEGIDLLRERMQRGIDGAKAELADELGLGQMSAEAEAAERDHRRAQDALKLAQARAAEAKEIAGYTRTRLRNAARLYDQGCAEIDAAFAIPTKTTRARG